MTLPLSRALLFGALLAAATPASAESPRIHYMLHCQGCHLADGSGSPGAVPPLKGVVGRLLRAPRGREYLVRVPGSAQSELTDAELAGVLNWIVVEYAGVPLGAFERFDAEEVARHRGTPLTDVETLRRELLGFVPAEAEPPR